ncbi:MAG: hypothetical protein HOV83_40485 [Catenulispora sp.]|nr:hypothetical protein [Catenulispora sp.]
MDEENATHVERDGLAVVHRGEKIVAAAGSEAVLTAHPGGEVHYHFPVHVVMVGDLDAQTRQDIRDDVLDRLYDALS